VFQHGCADFTRAARRKRSAPAAIKMAKISEPAMTVFFTLLQANYIIRSKEFLLSNERLSFW
jgi:hypothetical protein